jgi:hypothetical protein
MRTRLAVLGLVVMTVLLFVASAASATTVTKAARLVAADRMEGDRFGYAVATSGDTVFVGDAFRTVDSLTAAGAVYVYAGSGWTQTQRLTGTDGAAEAGFGLAVAAQGDTLAVGAPRATENGVPFGAVYVYKNVAGVWTLEQRLMASDPGQMADFGYSVALDGDQLVVGCPTAFSLGPKATLGSPTASGAAYVFSRSGGVWSQTAKLQASAATSGAHLGFSVAISGDTVMASSPGAVGISGGALMAGLKFTEMAGRVWVFTRAGGAWSQTQLIEPAGGPTDMFGMSMALAGDECAIGAPAETVGTNVRQGAAYVYVRSGGVWSLAQKLTRAEGAANDGYGHAVARSGGVLVVTDMKSRDESPSRYDGALYVYTWVDGAWVQQAASAKPSDAAASEMFGGAVALSGGTAVVGAPYLNMHGNPSAGAAYVYSLTETVTPSVSGGNGAISPADAQVVTIGGTPAFTFAPAEGYAVDTVLVDGVAVTMTGTNAYTFAPVYADHTISVSFHKTLGPTTTLQYNTNVIYFKHPITIICLSQYGPRAGQSGSSSWDGKGMPPSSTQYKIGKGKWKLGTKFTVRRQGVTKVRARSSDARGVVGPTAKATVRIDYTIPVVTGYGRPQARTGTATSFRFKVKDKPVEWARAMLAVTRYGYPEQQYDLGKVPTGRKISRSVKLDLGLGTWSWRIVVRDPAHNRGLCSWRYLDVSP